MSDNNIMQALFNQQRIQIMHIGKHHSEFSDAYLYAWSTGVYPFLDDTDGSTLQMCHEPYQDFFKVSKFKGEFLLKRFDDAYNSNERLTFYELENELNARDSSSDWNRGDILKLCRYFYLHDQFEEQFWTTLATNGESPIEANSLGKDFKRDRDISFM